MDGLLDGMAVLKAGDGSVLQLMRGDRVLARTSDATVAAVQLEGGQLLPLGTVTLPTDDGLVVHNAPAGDCLLVCWQRKIGYWDIAKGKLMAYQQLPPKAALWTTADMSSTHIAVGHENGDVSVLLRDTLDIVGCIEQMHTDYVSQVKFHPLNPSLLFSAAEDWLVNMYNLNQSNVDDALECVFNTEQASQQLGFFGVHAEYMYSVSMVNTLDLLNLSTNEHMHSIPDPCAQLSLISGLQLTYLIDCLFDDATSQLFVYAGDDEGRIFAATVSPAGFKPAFYGAHIHTDTVRCITRIGNVHISGSDDGTLAAWLPYEPFQ